VFRLSGSLWQQDLPADKRCLHGKGLRSTSNDNCMDSMSKCLPWCAQRPKSFQDRYVSNLQGDVYFGTGHLITHNPKEADGSKVVVWDEQDSGPGSMIVGGSVCSVVPVARSQVGGAVARPPHDALGRQVAHVTLNAKPKKKWGYEEESGRYVRRRRKTEPV